MKVKLNLNKHKIDKMDSENRRERLILDDQFKFVTDLNEFRMSLWVVSFGIIENKTGVTILELVSYFHLDKFEELDKVLNIKFRIYPNGSKSYEVQINPFNKTFVYQDSLFPLSDFYKIFKREEDRH